MGKTSNSKKNCFGKNQIFERPSHHVANIMSALAFVVKLQSKRLCTAVVPNLGPPDVLGLQLPEILANRSGGEGFWELQSKNIWKPKVGDHWCTV